MATGEGDARGVAAPRRGAAVRLGASAVLTVRVLIVENKSPLFGHLAARLNRLPRFAARATRSGAVNSREARQFHPDVILLTPGMQNEDTLQALDTIRKSCPGARVIVLDIRPVDVDLVRLGKAGVSGFLLKDAMLGDLVRTVQTVAKGGSALPPDLAGALFRQIPGDSPKRDRLPRSVRMTRREHQITELIAEGLGNEAIARRLDISTHTVKTHVHSVLAKLGLRTRLEVAVHINGRRAPRYNIPVDSGETPDAPRNSIESRQSV